MKPTFHADNDRPRLTIIDPIQRRQYPLTVDELVEPKPTDATEFYFPVDNAIEIEASSLTLPYVVSIYVRDGDGKMLLESDHYVYEELPEDEYIIELAAPVKLYINATSTLTIASSADRMELDFGKSTTMQIGARSYHDQPAGTVTTTSAPRDVMAAVSTFGSALKTTSCERSFPTLRGHPPTLELGDELAIPDGVSSPDTGVRIEIPPTLEAILVSSPLAYYLGAELVPGDAPKLLADDGFVHRLDHPSRGFEGEVARVLKQLFFFDCVTRTEGYYKVDLHERQAVESSVDLSFERLYGASLSEQIRAYLDVPYSTIEAHVPTWRLTTHATPEPTNVESLPYIANDLSIVRMASAKPSENKSPNTSAVTSKITRSGDLPQQVESSDVAEAYVSPDSADSLEQVWLGDGKPLGADKLVKKGFENKFDRGGSVEEIDITIVCNDPQMSAEYDSEDLYGNRDELFFDITAHQELSVDELREVLRSETDFLHYIGHIEAGKFICHDGGLDAAELANVGVETFLLNGCKSYEQGMRLIDAGSVGGIVTFSDIGNSSAVIIGRLIARLLNRGFSLRSALDIARDQRIVGNQYVVVGDGGAEVAQCESGTPNLAKIESLDDGTYELTLHTYPTVNIGMGTLFVPFLNDDQTHYLSGGELPPFTLSAESLAQFLRLDQIPILLENEFMWSANVDLGEL